VRFKILVKAGMLLDASGLQPSSKGWRIRDAGKQRTVIDGPFAETKELIAGYPIIPENSHQEALEWSGATPTPLVKASPPRWRCGSCSNSKTSRPVTAWKGFRDIEKRM
jgi:hypothetical protein